jgi:hypothetical protein
MRVRGVGEEYSDLLEKGGEDTAAELAQRNPDYLHAKMVAANRSMYLVRRMPTRAMVADWIAQAKTLPRVVSH